MPSVTRAFRPIVVAGHVCLDLTPDFAAQAAMPGPGQLVEVGQLAFSAGGAVANVGGALGRLGVPVRMIARVGQDALGRHVNEQLLRSGGTTRLVQDACLPTSYSIVLAPAGTDRCFLHAPGANHGFEPSDVSDADLDGAAALHFGYPPAMRSVQADGGSGLCGLFSRARAAGLLTSLDFCSPDMTGDCGRVDWEAWLGRVLPETSLFCPSLPELQAVLHTQLGARPLALHLLELGCSAVVIKMGDQGLYLRTGPTAGLATGLPEGWACRELYAPCFRADVVTANGAGDCSIAGLLACCNLGGTAEEALTAACAVGGCSVEAADAISGVQPWRRIHDRIGAGWPRRAVAGGFADFIPAGHGCFAGLEDQT